MSSAHRSGGIALRVQVDHQHFLAGFSKCRGKIDSRRGLADAALLIRDGDKTWISHAVYSSSREGHG